MGNWYTGITLGPIYDTLQLVSSPSGLWGASTLFSWIARRLIEELCKKLMEKGIEADAVSDCFLSPYFSWDDVQKKIVLDGCEDMVARGVGMFHDRIIMEGNHAEDFSCVLKSVTDELADSIHSDIKRVHPEMDTPEDLQYIRGWLDDYLRIYAIVLEVPDTSSPILYLGDRLGALELEGNFVSQENYNPLLALFENAFPGSDPRKNGNDIIKGSFLLSNQKDWMLLDGKNIRNIENIASAGWESVGEWKTGKYYAILQSDGDSMGKTLSQLKNKKEIQAFSKKCLGFCAEAARIMLDYGGMPIYAGGDDLLAILPVIGHNSQEKDKNEPEVSIFRLLETIHEKFNSSFYEERAAIEKRNAQANNDTDVISPPTISFGVTIQYMRSPLYEAMDASGSLLWEIKQSTKNSLAMSIHKHSGSPLRINLEYLDSNKISEKSILVFLDELVMQARTKYDKESQTESFYRNAGYQLEKHNSLLRHAIESCNEKQFDNLFDNLFDNINQDKYQKNLQQLCKLCKQLAWGTTPKHIGTSKPYGFMNTIDRIGEMLRVLRFMTERGGETE